MGLFHPSPLELGAWFDGEPTRPMGRHILSCRRCGNRLNQMAGIRSWLRASPFVVMATPYLPAPAPRQPARAAVAAMPQIGRALLARTLEAFRLRVVPRTSGPF